MATPSWHSTYLSALSARDIHEHRSRHVYDAYTRLADRQALANPTRSTPDPNTTESPMPAPTSPAATIAALGSSPPTTNPPGAWPVPAGYWPRRTPSTPPPAPQGADPLSTSPSSQSQQQQATLQTLLQTAQTHRSALEAQLASTAVSLTALKTQLSGSSQTNARLTSENTLLKTRMRDRDDELRAKSKLLQDVHDETLALEMQLNVAEEKARKLEAENRELVSRWMERVGREAERLNDENMSVKE